MKSDEEEELSDLSDDEIPKSLAEQAKERREKAVQMMGTMLDYKGRRQMWKFYQKRRMPDGKMVTKGVHSTWYKQNQPEPGQRRRVKPYKDFLTEWQNYGKRRMPNHLFYGLRGGRLVNLNAKWRKLQPKDDGNTRARFGAFAAKFNVNKYRNVNKKRNKKRK